MKFLKTRTNSDRVLSAKDSPTRRWKRGRKRYPRIRKWATLRILLVVDTSRLAAPLDGLSRIYLCLHSTVCFPRVSLLDWHGGKIKVKRQEGGKGRLADIYPSLWCAFSRREEEIIRGQVREGIITLVIRERRCVWEKMRKIKKGGRGRDEDIWIFDARVTVISRKRGISKGS